MKYILSTERAAQHEISIEAIFNTSGEKEIQLCLPAWRPGRYELGNFAKNIISISAKGSSGEQLPMNKTSKDSWLIKTKEAKEVVVSYTYYANEINAGSSYLGDDQLYVNPVNCLLYQKDKLDDKCVLELRLDSSYKVATSLKKQKGFTYVANSFHELADSPFIASSTLKYHSFTTKKVLFHLWFQGECKPDWKLLEKDFKKFCSAQISLMKRFPEEEYHFLFQILPYKAYHGVEHSRSTVILLGPSYSIMDPQGWYLELLGVSSHELFHTWNVKNIRPTEMMPYDYSKENYTKLGYLTEGVTTYYGDLILYRSGVFSREEYLKTFNQLLKKHYTNPARLNMSVADSSYDTWLDGYVTGAPGRKTSIYTEGALCAFMLDVLIRKESKDKYSLDDLMRKLYANFGKKGIGVTEQDYLRLAMELGGEKVRTFFKNYIYGTKDYTAQLKSSLDYVGYRLVIDKKAPYAFAAFGMSIQQNKIENLYPDSHANSAGLRIKDEILSINGIIVGNDVEKWLQYFGNDKMELLIKNEYGLTYTVEMSVSDKYMQSLYVAEYAGGKKDLLK